MQMKPNGLKNTEKQKTLAQTKSKIKTSQTRIQELTELIDEHRSDPEHYRQFVRERNWERNRLIELKQQLRNVEEGIPRLGYPTGLSPLPKNLN